MFYLGLSQCLMFVLCYIVLVCVCSSTVLTKRQELRFADLSCVLYFMAGHINNTEPEKFIYWIVKDHNLVTPNL